MLLHRQPVSTPQGSPIIAPNWRLSCPARDEPTSLLGAVASPRKGHWAGEKQPSQEGAGCVPPDNPGTQKELQCYPPLGQWRQLDGKSETNEQGSQRKGENQGSVPAGVCSVASCGTFSRLLPLVGLTDPIFQSVWSGRTTRQSLRLLPAPTSHYSTA